jgi:hypothetical protein
LGLVALVLACETSTEQVATGAPGAASAPQQRARSATPSTSVHVPGPSTAADHLARRAESTRADMFRFSTPTSAQAL